MAFGEYFDRHPRKCACRHCYFGELEIAFRYGDHDDVDALLAGAARHQDHQERNTMNSSEIGESERGVFALVRVRVLSPKPLRVETATTGMTVEREDLVALAELSERDRGLYGLVVSLARSVAHLETSLRRAVDDIAAVADALPMDDWTPGECTHAEAVARVVAQRDAAQKALDEHVSGVRNALPDGWPSSGQTCTQAVAEVAAQWASRGSQLAHIAKACGRLRPNERLDPTKLAWELSKLEAIRRMCGDMDPLDLLSKLSEGAGLGSRWPDNVDWPAAIETIQKGKDSAFWRCAVCLQLGAAGDNRWACHPDLDQTPVHAGGCYVRYVATRDSLAGARPIPQSEALEKYRSALQRVVSLGRAAAEILAADHATEAEPKA